MSIERDWERVWSYLQQSAFEHTRLHFESHQAIIANCRAHPGVLELIKGRAEEIQHDTHAAEIAALETKRAEMVSRSEAQTAAYLKAMEYLQQPLTLREKVRSVLRGVLSVFGGL